MLTAAASVGCSADVTAEDATGTLHATAPGTPIAVSPTVSAISEAGDEAFFRVSLAARPRGRVTLTITTSDASEAQVTPSRVVFGPNDWSRPRTLTVQAVDDNEFDGDVPVQVVFAPAKSPDPRVAGYQVPALDVLSVDDDYVVTGYVARDLFPAGAAIEARAVAINNRGQIVGDFSSESVLHPFLWDNGQITDLGSLGGGQSQSHALDINDAGVVLGWSDTLEGVKRFLYQDGQLVATPGDVWALNDRGHTVGDFLFADGQQIDVPDLSETPAVGLALNDNDDVTGYAPTPPFFQHAFVWADGQFSDLGTFGGPIGAGLSINQHGQVVGRMFNSTFNHRPFYYDGGQVVELGTATGTPGGVASSINNRGDIVGTDLDAGGLPETGFIGRPGDIRSLEAMLVDGSCFFFLEAVAINDSGVIAGNGFRCVDARRQAVVLEPVKVPK